MGAPKHSSESLKWLEENYKKHIYSNIMLSKMFSSMFRPITRRQVACLASRYGWTNCTDGLVGRKIKKEHLEWLLENHSKYERWTDLANAFSKIFYPLTAESASRILGRRGIKKETPDTTPFTEEQRRFLDEWIPNHTREETKTEFNKRFSSYRTITQEHITAYAKRYGLKTPKNLLYQTRSEKAKERSLPLGTERVFNTSGKAEIFVKVKNLPQGGQMNWKRKKIMVWEEQHKKPLPSGMSVVCLDGDETNFSPENLYATTRQKSLRSFSTYRRHHPGLSKLCGAAWVKTYLMVQELRFVLKDKGVRV